MQLDDCKRAVMVPSQVERVICLCPSISETIVDLAPGLLVGRTRYCIHPLADVQNIPTVGGTKNPDIGAIRALKPDLIIAEKEENRLEDVQTLESIAPTWVFDVGGVESAMRMIAQLGALLGRNEVAAVMLKQIDALWPRFSKAECALRALYLIWRKPWMGAASGTYIHSVLESLGLENVLADQERYPELSLDQMQALEPQLILLSSEPYPFTSTHQKELQNANPSARVELVDGEAFSWYGSRMRAASAELRALAQAWNSGRA